MLKESEAILIPPNKATPIISVTVVRIYRVFLLFLFLIANLSITATGGEDCDEIGIDYGTTTIYGSSITIKGASVCSKISSASPDMTTPPIIRITRNTQ